MEMRSNLMPCVVRQCRPALILWETLGPLCRLVLDVVESGASPEGGTETRTAATPGGLQINGFMANATSSSGSAAVSASAGLDLPTAWAVCPFQAREYGRTVVRVR